jgi:electron transfer flavoprotein beta subunit
MKIAVCLKEVLDTRLPLQVEARTGSVTQTGTERVNVLNPADRGALEFAMQLRGQVLNTTVEVFSVCDTSGQEALWFAFARGVDYVERIENDSLLTGSPYTAALLAMRFAQAQFDLICCGDETLDNSSAIVGPLLAEILELPQVTGVLRLVEHTGRSIVVERGLEHGNRELVEMELPGLVTLRSEGVELRYVSFRRLLAAKNHEIPMRRSKVRDGQFFLPRWPENTTRVRPRARVKKAFAPDAKSSPAERMRMIMSGGIAPQEAKAKSSIVEGDAEYVSEQLYRFLKHHEFV